MGSKRIKTGVKTAVFVVLGCSIVSLFAWITYVVQQVRASFDIPEAENNISEWEETENTPGVENQFLSFKLRLTISVLLFLVVFFCKYNAYPIFGIEVSEIIDMISDNQYYTFLQTYVKM